LSSFNVKDWDTHNAAVITGPSGPWLFTTPVAGKYLIIVAIELSNSTNFDTDEQGQIKIIKNYEPAIVYRIWMQATPTSWGYAVVLPTILNLAVSDTIHIVFYHLSGDTEYMNGNSNANWITIQQLS
jgi:hypothetical protein